MKVIPVCCSSCKCLHVRIVCVNSWFNRLEVFNSVVLNNMSKNPNLIYGILQAHRTFEELGTFTLARGLREIQRVQSAKEGQVNNAEGNPKGKDRSVPGEDSDPGAEKARLLESEGVTSAAAETVESPPRISVGSEEGSMKEDELQMDSLADPQSEGSVATSVSEKARGKMKERLSMSSDMNHSLELLAAAGIGRNGFVPTQEWVSDV